MKCRVNAFMVVCLIASGMAVCAAEKQSTAEAVAPSQTKVIVAPRVVDQSATNKVLINRVARLRQARDILRRQAALPLPKNLSPKERKEALRFNKWLKKSARELDA